MLSNEEIDKINNELLAAGAAYIDGYRSIADQDLLEEGLNKLVEQAKLYNKVVELFEKYKRDNFSVASSKGIDYCDPDECNHQAADEINPGEWHCPMCESRIPGMD